MNWTVKSWLWSFIAGKIKRRVDYVLWAALFCAEAAAAQDGYWINAGGGSWAGAANWDSADGIAGGADSTAYFGFGREAVISPNASFTLSGTQTIGNLCFTSPGGQGTWNFNPVSGGSLNLDATFGPPEITVTSPALQVVFNAAVAGTTGVEKDGAGTLVLAAQNTYSGQTQVKGGGLSVTGLVGAGGVSVANAALSGSGVILGPVVVGPGGILSLGNVPGPLTISNSLTLLPGSTTMLSLNAATSSPVAVRGLSSLVLGGTLRVNLSGAVSLGQSFSIFGSVPSSGNFSRIQPPPGPWLRWRFDPATGAISVVSSASQPAFSKVNLAGSHLVCQLTAGPPGSPCYIISAASLSQPRTAWACIATNVFDVSGGFTATNDLNGLGAGPCFISAFVIPTP